MFQKAKQLLLYTTLFVLSTLYTNAEAAGVKLSAIASGGAVASSTDQLVGVRSGATDVLLTVGSSCVENLTSIVIDNGAGGLTLGAGQVTNAMLVNSSMTLAGHSVPLGGTQTFAFSDLTGQATNAQLATQTANTVLGALTATTPSGLPLPSCTDTSGNHLNYTSGTGFSCGTSDSHVGTVTSIATTAPITGGTITTTGTIACATCATTTNGGALSGTAPIAVSAGGVISGGGLGTVNGALKGNGSGTITQAACADLSNGGTACAKNTGTSGSNVPLLNGINTWGAGQIATQSTPTISTATFTPDFSAGNHFIINLVHASCPCTLANPTNIVAGQSGVIAVVQSSTGSDLINTYGTDYVFTNASAGVLSTGANKIDYYSYYVEDSTHIRMNFIPAVPQSISVGGVISNQTKFTISGCSTSATVGGATAGTYTSGTTGTCTVTITMNGATGLAANNGWSCWANDETTTADKQQTTSSTTTTATISGTTVSGDVIDFGCMGF